MIIAAAGQARSGKDTTANYLVKEYGFKRVAFADPLKNACMEIFGLTHDQVYGDFKELEDPYWKLSPRQILQMVGTDCLRNHFDEDIWIKAAIRKMMQEPETNWVISDLRFWNEAEALKKQGAMLIRLFRNVSIPKGMDHASETELKHYDKWDHTIINNGTIEELYQKIDTIIQKII